MRVIQRRALQTLLLVFAAPALGGACHDLSNDPVLPSGIQDPAVYRSAAGAQLLVRGTRTILIRALADVIRENAMFSDEASYVALSAGLSSGGLDQRIVNAPSASYTELQNVRGQARLARGTLERYGQSLSPTLRAEMYAVEGYADLLLADMYCSGIPLSTIDYDGDFTLQAGSPTIEVYRQASVLLDSAVTFATGDDSLMTFARVVWGRALLARGLLDSAAQVVSSVPDTSAYRVRAVVGSRDLGSGPTFLEDYATQSDREGTNGLPYRSSFDARTQAVSSSHCNSFGLCVTIFFPAKYQDFTSGNTTSVTIASGTEARLIQAEQALHDNHVSQWLSIINAMRTDGTFTAATRLDPISGDSVGVDTTWGFGTVRVANQSGGVRPLRDPGTQDARVDSLFSDRAFWLFLTAHREGDLRREIRQYRRNPDSTYPTGTYLSSARQYDEGVVLTVPARDESTNPKYTGCINHGA